MNLKNSVEAGLGGVRLPSPIIEADKTFTNLSNLVPMEVYKTHTIRKVNFGVVLLPVTLGDDGSVHPLFDLTHGRVSCG